MTALVVARAYLSPMLILLAFERPDAHGGPTPSAIVARVAQPTS